MNTSVCPLVRRVAAVSSNIPLVWMSLLTLALTDKCRELTRNRQETTQQALFELVNSRFHVKT